MQGLLINIAQVWLQRDGGTKQASPLPGGFAASSAFFRTPLDLLEYQPMHRIV